MVAGWIFGNKWLKPHNHRSIIIENRLTSIELDQTSLKLYEEKFTVNQWISRSRQRNWKPFSQPLIYFQVSHVPSKQNFTSLPPASPTRNGSGIFLGESNMGWRKTEHSWLKALVKIIPRNGSQICQCCLRNFPSANSTVSSSLGIPHQLTSSFSDWLIPFREN